MKEQSFTKKQKEFIEALKKIGFKDTFNPDFLTAGHAGINIRKINTLEDLLKALWVEARRSKIREIKGVLQIVDPRI